MISSLSPGFLAAGLALAAAPVLLHLLARRPPERQPLPTARFLMEDARTFLRLQNRPTDLPLLCVRIAFALALGASFAGMTWIPDRNGPGRVVLLDGGADTLSDWGVARELARRAALDQGDTEPATILVYGLDDDFRIVTPEGLAGLDRGGQSANAEDGLRALRSGVLSRTHFESVAVVWVTRPSWRSWSPGVGLLRAALWPGRTPIVPVPELARTDPAGAPFEPAARNVRTAGLAGLPDDQNPLPRALRALGVDVVASADGLPDPDADWSFAETPTAGALGALVERARTGATVVLSGRLLGAHADLPWVPDPAAPREPSGIVLATGIRLGLSIAREGGAPTPGAKVIAVFEDATAAAAATPVGDGCLVYLSASLQDPALTASPDYPSLVDALGKGCSEIRAIDGPLDRGALHALERPDLAAVVVVADLATAVGYPLTRWLMLLALALLALEVALTRERRP